MDGLRIVEASLEDGRVMVQPHGEIDVGNVQDFEDVLRRVSSTGAGVVLDLRRLAFIDSMGLGVIARTCGAATQAGTSFTIVPGRRSIQRLFSITGLETKVGFEDPSAIVSNASSDS